MMSDRNIKRASDITVDKLAVEIYRTRQDMGSAAGAAVAGKVRELLSKQESVTMVFAAAPSQNEFLEALSIEPGVDWSRVVAFHLDEYIGLPDDAPQRFVWYLKEHIFERVNPGKVYYLNGNPISPAEECERYSRLLKEHPLDIACIGIGENGHIAFNDPPFADFADPHAVKVVELDEKSRLQQVHDGCFSSLDQVPTHALTMTVPAIMSAHWLYCMVPGPTKREAVKRALEGEISTECPASILRTHDNATLFLDLDSAAGLKGSGLME